MLIYLLRKLFTTLIGNIPEEKKRQLQLDFNDLLRDVVKAAAEGAVKGVIK